MVALYKTKQADTSIKASYMHYFDSSAIQTLALHKVGNKASEEGVRLSQAPINVDESISQLLLSYFLSPFKSGEYHNLYHDSDITLNEVYVYVSKIFDNPDTLHEQSVHIAKHLYEQSVHPKIKSGELYVAYFTDCVVDGEQVDAVGIFKSENKETFLKVYPSGSSYTIEQQEGINISKLDKGCLIFNTEREQGYLVSVVDTASKGSEAQYWTDDFLHIRQRNDSYAQTKHAIALCKAFVTERMPEAFEVSRADQADLLNQSAKFFKEKDNFNLDEFADAVIQQSDMIDSFKSYKGEYVRDFDIKLEDEFDISAAAVKKQARVLKSVIKLDKNFHIYVHGNRELIEKGFDPTNGMHFYRLLFKDEE